MKAVHAAAVVALACALYHAATAHLLPCARLVYAQTAVVLFARGRATDLFRHLVYWRMLQRIALTSNSGAALILCKSAMHLHRAALRAVTRHRALHRLL